MNEIEENPCEKCGNKRFTFLCYGNKFIHDEYGITVKSALYSALRCDECFNIRRKEV